MVALGRAGVSFEQGTPVTRQRNVVPCPRQVRAQHLQKPLAVKQHLWSQTQPGFAKTNPDLRVRVADQTPRAEPSTDAVECQGLTVINTRGQGAGSPLSTNAVRDDRGTSLMRNSPPPWDHHRALGILLLQVPRGALLQGYLAHKK